LRSHSSVRSSLFFSKTINVQRGRNQDIPSAFVANPINSRCYRNIRLSLFERQPTTNGQLRMTVHVFANSVWSNKPQFLAKRFTEREREVAKSREAAEKARNTQQNDRRDARQSWKLCFALPLQPSQTSPAPQENVMRAEWAGACLRDAPPHPLPTEFVRAHRQGVIRGAPSRFFRQAPAYP